MSCQCHGERGSVTCTRCPRAPLLGLGSDRKLAFDRGPRGAKFPANSHAEVGLGPCDTPSRTAPGRFAIRLGAISS